VAEKLQISNAPGPLNDARQLVGARLGFPGIGIRVKAVGSVRTLGFNQEK